MAKWKQGRFLDSRRVPQLPANPTPNDPKAAKRRRRKGKGRNKQKGPWWMGRKG